MKLSKKALEQKIKAVNKIAKITKAMKIIARMRFQKLAPQLADWTTLMLDLQFLIRQFQPFQPPQTQSKNNQPLPQLNVLFTSDLGLCGSYNTNLFQFIKQVPATKWIVIGRKGINYFRFARKSIWFATQQSDLQSQPTLLALITKIVTLVAETEHQINFFYTHPTSLTEFENRHLILWPASALPEQATDEQSPSELVFEPSATIIWQNQLPFYLETAFRLVFMLAKLSEQAIRQRMMESATENAQTMVNDLKLKYNQTRQENITNQLLEVSQA